MTFTTTHPKGDGWDRAATLIVGMGLALGGSGLLHVSSEPFEMQRIGLVLVGAVLPAGLVYGGYWLADRDVSRGARRRVLTWVSSGVVIAGSIAAWTLAYVGRGGGTIADPLAFASTLVAAGGLAGFVAAATTIPARQTASPTLGEFTPVADGRGSITDLSTGTVSVLEALANERSRATLAALLEGDGASSVAILADRVAEGTGTDGETAAITLRHATLPGLEASGLIEWDRSTDRVALVDESSVIDAVRELEAAVGPSDHRGQSST